MSIGKLFFLLSIFSLLFNSGCRNTTNDAESQEGLTGSFVDVDGEQTQSSRTSVFSPEEELAGFTVPDGFVVELVASEEHGIINPIDITFDDAGRLWTQTAIMYPLDPVSDIGWEDLQALIEDPEAQRQNPSFKRILDLYQGKTKGADKILILSNLYDDKDIKVDIWADGLAIPQSILPYKNGSYVAQGSELFFLSDTNQDGKADKRTPLFTGFGYTDTHTMAHVLVRGPGDWIHFSQGALNKGEVSSLVSDAKLRIDYSKIARFSLDAKKIELINAGLNNIWGFQLRGNGQWYGTEANDLGYSVVPMEVGTGYPGIGNDRLRTYQPWMPKLHDFRVGGTGLSGLAFADDSAGPFSEEYPDVAFLANPITSAINMVRIVRSPDGSVSAEHLPDFLTSEDDWFRPVNIEFGPDGCLYIADWYNKIISHNEVPTTHPDRDKSHGRIWRVRPESQEPKEIPNLYEVKANELVGFLKSPSLWAKRAAWHQISDRPREETKALVNDLVALASDTTQDELTRILTLWSLEGLYHYDKHLMKALLLSDQDNLRREAVRSLASFSLSAEEVGNALQALVEDNNAMVRSQVLRTLDEVGTANLETIGFLVMACKPPLEGNSMEGAYQRDFERYLARKALENYPGPLSDFIESTEAAKYNTSNLIWASQALPKQERERVFLDLWKKARYKELDEPTFIIVASMLDNRSIYNAVRPVLEQKDKAEQHVSIVLKNLGKVQSEELTRLLEKPVRALLEGKERHQQYLGLDAVGKLKINSLRSSVLPLIGEGATAEMVNLGMLALESRPVENKDIFSRISKNDTLRPQLRASAIQILARADLKAAYGILSDWFSQPGELNQKSVTEFLSGSAEGSTLLKQLFANGLITIEAFDISSAEKVYLVDKNDANGKVIFSKVKERLENDRKAFAARLEKFMAIAEKKRGNVANGEKLFQTCLLCHSVGDKGHNFAPALDGSALRDNEALLTAILYPDAAVESSYAIYRVVKKDGTNVEGYLIRNDGRGTAIGFMGGSEQFIQASEISSKGFLQGRSFMPKGLIDHYSDEEVSDLLAYMRTLK